MFTVCVHELVFLIDFALPVAALFPAYYLEPESFFPAPFWEPILNPHQQLLPVPVSAQDRFLLQGLPALSRHADGHAHLASEHEMLHVQGILHPHFFVVIMCNLPRF